MTWHTLCYAKSLQLCPTLCDPIDSSPPGSPVPGILQARTLEWAAISFSSTWKWKVKVKSFSRVRLLATLWTAAYQAPWDFPSKSTGVRCHLVFKDEEAVLGSLCHLKITLCSVFQPLDAIHLLQKRLSFVSLLDTQDFSTRAHPSLFPSLLISKLYSLQPLKFTSLPQHSRATKPLWQSALDIMDLKIQLTENNKHSEKIYSRKFLKQHLDLPHASNYLHSIYKYFHSFYIELETIYIAFML